MTSSMDGWCGIGSDSVVRVGCLALDDAAIDALLQGRGVALAGDLDVLASAGPISARLAALDPGFHTAGDAIVKLLTIPSLNSGDTLPRQLEALLEQSRHLVLRRRGGARSCPKSSGTSVESLWQKKMPVSIN